MIKSYKIRLKLNMMRQGKKREEREYEIRIANR